MYQQLKADAELGSIPVIVLASLVLDVDVLKELNSAEADSYLLKPFGADELLSCIDRLLRRD